MTLPGKDKTSLINYRIDQAFECIDEVELLIRNERLRLAVSRIYYGVFYIVTDLALTQNFKTSIHRQLIGWFNKAFIRKGTFPVKYGKYFRDAFARRSDVNYGDIVEYSFDEVQEWFSQMKDFIETVKNYIDTSI